MRLCTGLAVTGLLVGLIAGASPSQAGASGVTGALSSTTSPASALLGAMAGQSAPRAAASQPYRPPQGPLFNNPFGSVDQRFRIERHIVQAIKHTPKTGHIRISLYSFDRVDVAKALIAARNRGVQVQILLNGHQVTRAQRLLHRRLGTNPRRKNFAYECVNSCRGRRDYLHTKFYLFSRTGKADKVLMVGSANLTLNAVKWQWNDLYTQYGNEGLFRDFVRLFNDMRHDYKTNQPFYLFCGKDPGTRCFRREENRVGYVFPRKVTSTDDTVLNLLNDVRCVYPKPGGGTARTKVRLSMHTMQGHRGKYIAAKMRRMWASGCDIKVIYGLMGFHVKQTLGASTTRGRIPLRSAGFDYNDDGDVDRYTHQKYVTIKGRWGGNDVSISFTGSSNWSSRGASGDEIMYSVRGPGNLAAWNNNWQFMWDKHTRNAYTTTSSDYRVAVPTIDADGNVATRMVTRTVITERVLPDRLSAGPGFERD